jgi:hypothetical protein
MGLKQPPAAALEFGKAYHKTIESSFLSDMDGKGHLTAEEAQDIFIDSFNRFSEDVDWSLEDKRKGNLADTGVKLVGEYVEKYAPKHKPVGVEVEFSIELDGIEEPFVGVIDLQAADYMTDHKTASRGWSAARLESTMQPEAYYLAYKAITGKYPHYFSYDVAVKTKSPYIQFNLVTVRTPYQLDLYRERIQAARDMVSREVFPRTNPDNWYCSPKWCGYYGHCINGESIHNLRLNNPDKLSDVGYEGI